MTSFVDQYGVPEFFCESLHSVEQVGPCRRLLFIINVMDGNGQANPTATIKLVLPAEALAVMAQKLAADFHSAPSKLASLPTHTLAN